MKKYLLLLLAFSFVGSISGQKSVNKLIDNMKKHEHATALTIPGWLIRTGFNMIEDEDMKLEDGYGDLVGGIKRLRMLFIDESVDMSKERIKYLIDEIKTRDGYVDYAIVKAEGNDVHVIVKEEGTRIKSLVVVAKGEDGFTIINLKTNIDMAELKSANLSYNKNRNEAETTN